MTNRHQKPVPSGRDTVAEPPVVPVPAFPDRTASFRPNWYDKYPPGSKTFEVCQIIRGLPRYSSPDLETLPPPYPQPWAWGPYEREPFPETLPPLVLPAATRTTTPTDVVLANPTSVRPSRKRKAEDDDIDIIGYEKRTGVVAQDGELKTYWKRYVVSAVEFELESAQGCGHSSSVLVHQQLPSMNRVQKVFSGIASFVMAVTYLGVASLFANYWSGRFTEQSYNVLERRSRNKDDHSLAVKRMKVGNKLTRSKTRRELFKQRVFAYLRPALRLGQWYGWVDEPTKHIGKRKVERVKSFLCEARGRIDRGLRGAVDYNVKRAEAAERRLYYGYPGPARAAAEAAAAKQDPQPDSDLFSELDDDQWRDDRMQTLTDVERTLGLLYSQEFLHFYRDFYQTPQSSLIGMPAFLSDEDLANLRTAKSVLSFMYENPDLLHSHNISSDTIRAIISDIAALEEGQLVPSFIMAVPKPIPGGFPVEDGFVDAHDHTAINLQAWDIEDAADSLHAVLPAVKESSVDVVLPAMDEGSVNAVLPAVNDSSVDIVPQPPKSPAALKAPSTAETPPSTERPEPPTPQSIMREPQEFPIQHSPLVPGRPPPKDTPIPIPGCSFPKPNKPAVKPTDKPAPKRRDYQSQRFISNPAKRLQRARALFSVSVQVCSPKRDATPETVVLKRRARAPIPSGRHMDHARFTRFIRSFPTEGTRWTWDRPPTWHRFNAVLEKCAKREQERFKEAQEQKERQMEQQKECARQRALEVAEEAEKVRLEAETKRLKEEHERQRLALEDRRRAWDEDQDLREKAHNVDVKATRERAEKFRKEARKQRRDFIRRIYGSLFEEDEPFFPPWDEVPLDMNPKKRREIDELLHQRQLEEERIREEKERVVLTEQQRIREEYERVEFLAEQHAREARRREEARRAARGGLRKPKSSIIPPIEAEWMAKARSTILVGDNDVVCKDMFGTELKGATFKRLFPPGQWLNDEAINGSLRYVEKYINDKAGITDYNTQTPKCVALNSFFWSCFQNGTDERKVKRQLGNRQNRITPENFMDLDTILIPQCSGMHWTLAVIKPRDRIIAHVDSLSRPSRDVTGKLLEVVRVMLGDKYHAGEWTVFNYESPRQTNGYDCGVFTIANGVCFGLGVDPMAAYSPTQLNLMRARITAVFLNEGFKGSFSLDNI